MIKSRKQKASFSRKRTREDDVNSIEDEQTTTVITPTTAHNKKVNHSSITTASSSFTTVYNKKVNVDASVTTETVQNKEVEDALTTRTEMKEDKTIEPVKTGPQKRGSNVRIHSRFDYQPGICKDYYETGYCGYGDNCIFAHIREEWKSGWKQEKEWNLEQEKKKKQKRMKTGVNDEQFDNSGATKDDKLPHACFICRSDFVNPVVTVCKHYFCESCALKHYNAGKNPKCAACGEPTGGQFNTAHEILKKQKGDAAQNDMKSFE
jgi:RING finger protein 113A